MIESPVIKRWQAEAVQKVILALLKNRFDAVPRDVVKRVSEIQDEKKLISLNLLASECADVDAFRNAIVS